MGLERNNKKGDICINRLIKPPSTHCDWQSTNRLGDRFAQFKALIDLDLKRNMKIIDKKTTSID